MLDRTLLDTREGFRKCVNPDFSLFFVVILYFFLAALSLHWCTRAFSSCSKRGLLFVVVRGLLIVVASLVCRAQALGAQAQSFWSSGLVAPWHVESSWIKE